MAKTSSSPVYARNYQVIKARVTDEMRNNVNPQTGNLYTDLEILTKVNAEFNKNSEKKRRDLRPVDTSEAVALFSTYYNDKAPAKKSLDFVRKRATTLQPKASNSYLYRPTGTGASGPELFDFAGVDDGSQWQPGQGIPLQPVEGLVQRRTRARVSQRAKPKANSAAR